MNSGTIVHCTLVYGGVAEPVHTVGGRVAVTRLTLIVQDARVAIGDIAFADSITVSEGVAVLFRIAREQAGLLELICLSRTVDICEEAAVVSQPLTSRIVVFHH